MRGDQRMLKIFNKFLRDYNCLLLCLMMFIVASIAIPNFFTSLNILNILVETSIIGIMAIGMTFLLLIGLFDMSIGNQVSLVSLVIAITIRFGIIPSIILGLITGMAIGAINGFITSKLKINAFIVTFAMLGILKGANLLIFESQTNAQSIFIDNAIFGKIFNVSILGIPMVIIVFFMVAVIAELMLRYTKIGFEIYVTGGSIETARLSGVNTFLVTMFCFLASSLCVAISATLLTSRVITASPVLGEKYTLLVITACVIGGVKFTGGYGNIFNTFFGVLAMQLVNTIMYMTNTYGYIQSLINGMILIIVLSIDRFTTIKRSPGFEAKT